MALVVKDRVKVSTSSTGTGTISLGSAATGYQTFSVIGNGNTTYYTISSATSSEFEVGIGTFTLSGNTLSRDTVLSSSNGGSLVNFTAGTKDVFVTYPAERSVYLDNAGSYPVQNTFNALNATTATLTAGTVTTTPASGTDIANKTYVDTIAAAGIHYHTPVFVESPDTAGNLNATYNQPGGAGVGVGATLTNAGTQVALTIDGVLMTTTKRVLIYNQTNAAQNGVYTVTTVGSVSTNWVLTRATDADTYAPSSPNSLGQGDAFFVTSGDTGAGEGYVCTTVGVITFGTTAITFSQFSAAVTYNAGTGLNLSPSTTFNISNTAVTAGSYGLAGSVPTIAVNAQGQITSASNTAIAIASSAVSGLAASATTDTTNASNITSGTLPTGRLTGSYTGVTGVGTLTAGTWTATAIGAVYGGTGISSYAVGDILYADTTTSLAKLADVAVGNALISGGVASAPSYGKIGLATHVSGTLPVANGGTGTTTSTGSGAVVLENSPTLVTPALGTPSALVGTNITGTATGLSIGGNAATATNQSGGTVSATSIAYSTTLTGGTGIVNLGSGQFYKDASGNVGIGTSSPTAQLNLNADTDTTAYNGAATDGQLTAGATQLIRAAAGSNTNVAQLVFQARAAQPFNRIVSSGGTAPFMAFVTNNAERMRIDSSGNMGIGTTTPGTKLQIVAAGSTDVRSSVGNANAGFQMGVEATGPCLLANFVAQPIYFATNGTERMRIDSSGNLLIGTTTSPAGSKELVLGGDYIEGVVAIGTVTSTNTIALTNGTVQTATLTASTACTFTMPSNVAGKSFVLLLKQAAATGNGTATFTSVKWGTAGAPTITAAAGKMDILTFIADGTNWYGSIAQGFTP